MSNTPRDVDQAEVESRLDRFDRWGADAIGARLYDLARLQDAGLATERDELEVLALIAALAEKEPKSSKEFRPMTVVSRWTGSSFVTTTTDEPTDHERPLAGAELKKAREQVHALRRYVALLVESVDRAKLAKAGYSYDGRPLRGRR
jgi:hypothetical protein